MGNIACISTDKASGQGRVVFEFGETQGIEVEPAVINLARTPQCTVEAISAPSREKRFVVPARSMQTFDQP